MTIHVLVEGPSEGDFLDLWAPRLLRDMPVRVHPHQGKGALPADLDARPEPWKRGLLDQLPAKLRGFANALDPAADGVVVLVDADQDDAGAREALANEITAAAQRISSKLPVAVRFAVEELEAFYLGDLHALEGAFPGADMDRARAYEPDSIVGTWQLFGTIVGDGGANKRAWAKAMGPRVTTKAEKSRSPSFKAMVAALLELVPPAPARTKRRAWRHPQKPHRDPGRRR
jgi:Domain of unknown function (DUF4276)